MKRTPYISGLVLALLILGLAALVAACSGSADVITQTTLALISGDEVTAGTETTLLDGSADDGITADELSTFQSKDPFIQQAQAPLDTSSTVPGTTGTTGGTGGTTNTTYYTTTSYNPNTTGTTSHTTTTARPTTTTTAPHLHSLKILSVATVSGAGVVTFRVDGTTYKDRRAGDVVSTTWGQVKVVDISTASKVVTLLHGSETLILGVGQSTFE